ncbi:MAG TPA: hypothetical protein P5572_05305 [Phycisphaerae bacterium]|nr:hypothetical protein [Phycisphaerae bacterium]
MSINRHQRRAVWPFLLIGISLAAHPASGQVCAENPPPPTPLGSPSGCDHCLNSLLPGTLEPLTATRYYLESDLPEKLLSTGVLYATVPVLPPDSSGNPALAMRTQISTGGFTTIDDDFDVFLWHTSSPGDGSQPRRIVVYVRNDGTGAVELDPLQVMITDGSINVMGANLATRVLLDDWDTPVGTTVLAPGAGEVIAYSKRFAASSNNADQSANVNCFGRVRASVTNAAPATHPTDLKVYVVAIDSAPIAQNKSRAEALLGTGAISGDPFDLDVPPSGCANRRATGVMDSFVWRNASTTIDAADLVGDGIRYRMAVADLNSQTCPAGRQTQDLVLRPGFVRPDSVGNYMKDYRITLRVINTDPAVPRGLDLGFTQTGAMVGLAWRILVSDTPPTDGDVDSQPVRTGWAGASANLLERSLLESDGGPIEIAPCTEKYVAVHLLILGNSSLPFDLHVAPIAGEETIVDNRDANCVQSGSWPASSNSGYWGVDSQYHFGDGGASSVTWTPNLPYAGRYRVDGWWVVSSNRAPDAPFTIHHRDGVSTIHADQSDLATATRWNELGQFNFDAGSGGSVVLTSDVVSTKLVSADAVRFSYLGPLPGPGDFDADGDVDLADFAAWSGCMTGPHGSLSPGCAAFDFDADGDVDLVDFAAFARSLTGF